MIKKTIILGIILCSLLFTSTISVSAEDDLRVVDSENDVIDDYGEKVDRKNIDIVSATCNKDGGKVTVELTLIEGGKIQDSESVFYVIDIITSEYYYSASFGFGTCSVTDDMAEEIDGADPVCSGTGERTLTITFNLMDSTETLEEITASAAEFDLTNEEYYIDSTEIEMSLVIDTGGPYEGNVGESIKFEASVEGGEGPYEWQWFLDDEELSTDESPTHIFNKAGTYTITVMVMDESLNYGYEETTVTIKASSDDDDDDEENSGLLMFIVLIAIIVVAGIAVLIYAIRR